MNELTIRIDIIMNGLHDTIIMNAVSVSVNIAVVHPRKFPVLRVDSNQ